MMLKHYQIKETEKLLLYEKPIYQYKGFLNGKYFLINLYKKRESKGSSSGYKRIDVFYCVIFKDLTQIVNKLDSLVKTQSLKRFNEWRNNLNKKAECLK